MHAMNGRTKFPMFSSTSYHATRLTHVLQSCIRTPPRPEPKSAKTSSDVKGPKDAIKSSRTGPKSSKKRWYRNTFMQKKNIYIYIYHIYYTQQLFKAQALWLTSIFRLVNFGPTIVALHGVVVRHRCQSFQAEVPKKAMVLKRRIARPEA